MEVHLLTYLLTRGSARFGLIYIADIYHWYIYR